MNKEIKISQEEGRHYYHLAYKYQQTLKEIQKIIKNLEKEDILSFPDLSLKENVQIIISQCNKGYKEIFTKINEVLRD